MRGAAKPSEAYGNEG